MYADLVWLKFIFVSEGGERKTTESGFLTILTRIMGSVSRCGLAVRR